MSWMFNLTPNVTKKKTCLLSRHPSEVFFPQKTASTQRSGWNNFHDAGIYY